MYVPAFITYMYSSLSLEIHLRRTRSPSARGLDQHHRQVVRRGVRRSHVVDRQPGMSPGCHREQPLNA
jgi:hypothetical protein